MIGLYDCDLFDGKTFVPNPEIMLLSSYFKKKGEIVHLLLDFKNIDLYRKVFIRKNRNGKQITVTPDIYTRDNVDFGGMFFTKGIYSPIPQEILECSPDTTIYEKYLKSRKWETKAEREELGNARAEFISIHQRKVTETHQRKVFIIDPDITEDDYEYLCSIQKFTPKQVFHFYYPVIMDSVEGATKFLTADWFSCLQHISFRKELTVDEMEQVSKYKKGKITFFSYLNEKYRFKTQEEEEELIINCLEKILETRRRKLHFNFRIHPRTRVNSIPLLSAIEKWCNLYSSKSFYEFCDWDNKVRCRRIMEHYPNSKGLFFSNITNYVGGVW